jgi:hypothetical protein
MNGVHYVATSRFVSPRCRLQMPKFWVLFSNNLVHPLAAEFKPDSSPLIFFNLPNPSGRTMGSTQPLKEMSTRNIKKKKKKPGW